MNAFISTSPRDAWGLWSYKLTSPFQTFLPESKLVLASIFSKYFTEMNNQLLEFSEIDTFLRNHAPSWEIGHLLSKRAIFVSCQILLKIIHMIVMLIDLTSTKIEIFKNVRICRKRRKYRTKYCICVSKFHTEDNFCTNYMHNHR